MGQATAVRCVVSVGIAGGLLAGIAADVLANVGDPARWKPNFERRWAEATAQVL